MKTVIKTTLSLIIALCMVLPITVLGAVPDYKGKKQVVNDKYGCVLIPTTYELGKSEEYANLISDESSKRAIFKE